MKSSVFLLLFYKVCEVFAVEETSCIIQDSGVKRAQIGGTVSLNCSCRDATVSFISWYKQSLGGKPHIISKRMRHSTEAEIYPTYRERFQVVAQIQDGINNLIITNLQFLDSGTYFCGILEFDTTEFGQGVFLYVRNNHMQSSIHQPVLKALQLGDSVNLSCNVYAEHCAGVQSLCWLKGDASQPAVECPSNAHCVTTSNQKSLRKHCTSNLELMSVTFSDVGTYYCALTSCEKTVLGDATVIQIVDSKPSRGQSLLVYSLSAALAVSIVGLIIISFLIYQLQLKLRSFCEGTASHLTCSVSSNPMRGNVDNLHYAALSLKRSKGRHNQEEDPDSICVYSSVKRKNDHP